MCVCVWAAAFASENGTSNYSRCELSLYYITRRLTGLCGKAEGLCAQYEDVIRCGALCMCICVTRIRPYSLRFWGQRQKLIVAGSELCKWLLYFLRATGLQIAI